MATYTGKPQVNKRTLVNYIRHADTSNKVMEEREMWRMRSLELRGRFRDLSLPVLSREQQHSTIIRGRLVSDSVLEDDDDNEEERGQERESHGGNYWFKQLMKAEENDPDRWGHSGYKELYPEECLSSSDDEESLGIPIHRKRRHSHKKMKKKKSRHREEEEEAVVVKERDSHRRKQEKKPKLRKHKQKHDSGVSVSLRKSKHRDKTSKKHSRKRKLVRRTSNSSEESSPHLTAKQHRS